MTGIDVIPEIPERVIITGVSGGIGSATARVFLAEGWLVVGLDRVEPPVDLRTAIDYHQCDLGSSLEIEAVCRTLLAEGPVSALVNNAAIQLNKALGETTDEEWELVMNTNVRSAFVCMRELRDSLVETSGAVVNVSSVHAVATSANVGAYAASKGALVALTRAAAVELAEHGVRCNAVLPGAVDTKMLRDGLGRRPHPEGPAGNLRLLVERTPLLAVATPTEIAETILFLADRRRSSFLTGQAIVVDGGATARLSTE